jgi:tRNA threonylcarbamoyladenosine biosynthesis protein TsaB
VRTLAIETATAACSVALIEDGRAIASGHAVVGRGHAERLLPMIAGLPDGGCCDAILVDIGPGSFTGIRVGIAAARALGFAWGVPVNGYASLALLAAIDGGQDDTVVAIEGGHGELFVGRYGGNPLVELDAARSMPFAAVVAEIATRRIVGNAAHRLVEASGNAAAVDITPDACAVALLPPSLSALPAIPFYGRGADAKPMVAA